MTVVYTLFIPQWHPATINQLLRNRWAAASLKKSDREIVTWYCRMAKIPAALGKRRVRLTIILKPGQRAADPDSQHKSTLDALVHANALVDDNRQHVELAPVLYERATEKTWGTRIELEDLESPD